MTKSRVERRRKLEADVEMLKANILPMVDKADSKAYVHEDGISAKEPEEETFEYSVTMACRGIERADEADSVSEMEEGLESAREWMRKAERQNSLLFRIGHWISQLV
jgi:hypothetical protein